MSTAAGSVCPLLSDRKGWAWTACIENDCKWWTGKNCAVVKLVKREDKTRSGAIIEEEEERE